MTRRRPGRNLGEATAFTRPLVPVAPLEPEALTRSLSDAMAAMPKRQDEVWLFAYGSLMWAPCFAPAESRSAMLAGWRRSFNFWSTHARGTPDCPGLGLGLAPAPGDSCRGIACRLSRDTLDADLERLWAREMHTAVYLPKWLPVTTEQGAIDALCFVSDPAHPRYAGELHPDRIATVIAMAAGRYGTCRDYLAALLEALMRLNAGEPALRDLLVQVDAVRTRVSAPTS